MLTTFFKFKKHPGDFFRNTDIIELPNPDNNLDDFLIWFLDCYQSDERIARVNDLSKLIENEFVDESEKSKFIKEIGEKGNTEILVDIKNIETELKNEAFKNFYKLLLKNEIEVIHIEKNG
ncbi:hypothetical protein [uncultured Salegentibacter sp.]|uniref:hypothetical protein n=1 Tax=uncultured Salegentibacter sp. TaxID=259320 RepID=UPI0025991C97|nr:hypothetical protein [uncultured Salegentibacter sp.]